MEIKPGDLYEDAAYHPCLCIGVERDHVWGISLVDGSRPRVTDLFMSGIRKLTVEEAWQWRTQGPPDGDRLVEKKWW